MRMTATEKSESSAAEHRRLVIIGAGFGGIGMAIRLRTSGFDDFVVLERDDDLGGTWYVNTYPGIECDVPSILYSFSFAPKSDWSRTFAPGAEIENYIKECADRFDVKRSVRFGHAVREVRWDPETTRWTIDTDHGSFTADVVVAAPGGLSEPSAPAIAGIERFGGTTFHSAAWEHGHDLTGERVAVIGTGASAIQFVPAIQAKVTRLTVFQRSAPWVMPRRDRPLRSWEQHLYRRIPAFEQLNRAAIYWARELLVPALTRRPELTSLAKRLALRHLSTQVRDPEMRSNLTPDYKLGCKRVLLSNVYYPALTQPNVDLVTSPIAEVTKDSILTEDGAEHPVDTIIFGTGFDVATPPFAKLVRGRDGRTLFEHWCNDGSAGVYLGSTVPDFPNLFLITGPNTGLGHSSMIFMMESQFNYIIDALKTMEAREVAVVEVRPDAFAAYNDEVQQRLARSVWNSGCRSWYLDANGQNTTMWPGFTWEYWRRTRRFDAEHYITTPRASLPGGGI